MHPFSKRDHVPWRLIPLVICGEFGMVEIEESLIGDAPRCVSR